MAAKRKKRRFTSLQFVKICAYLLYTALVGGIVFVLVTGRFPLRFKQKNNASVNTADTSPSDQTESPEEIEYIKWNGDSVSEAFAQYIFNSALNRTPTGAELKEWNQYVLNGMSGTDTLYALFFADPNRLAGINNESFVSALYSTMKDTVPSQNEYAADVESLEKGSTRKEMYESMADSIEWANLCQKMRVFPGVSKVSTVKNIPYDETLALVRRLYKECIGTDISDGECLEVSRQLTNFETSVSGYVYSLFEQEKFYQSQYSDKEFINLVFKVFLKRDAEDEELEKWVGILKKDDKRENIINTFTITETCKDFRFYCRAIGILPMPSAAKPYQVRTEFESSDAIKILWSAPLGSDSIQVLESTDPDAKPKDFKLVGTYSALAGEAVVPVEKPDTLYYFALRAYTGIGAEKYYYSNYSTVVSAKALPKIPEDFELKDRTKNSLTFSWKKTENSSIQYEVWSMNSMNDTEGKLLTVTKKNEFKLSDLKSLSTRFIRIRAVQKYSNSKTKVYGEYTETIRATTLS